MVAWHFAIWSRCAISVRRGVCAQVGQHDMEEGQRWWKKNPKRLPRHSAVSPFSPQRRCNTVTGVQMWNSTTALQFLDFFSHYDWWWPAVVFLSTSQTFPALTCSSWATEASNRAAMTEEAILLSLPALLRRCKCALNQEGAERCSCRHLCFFSSSSPPSVSRTGAGSSSLSSAADETGEASSALGSSAAWFTFAPLLR